MVVSCQEKGQSRGIEGTKGDYGDMGGRRLCVGGGELFFCFLFNWLVLGIGSKERARYLCAQGS